MNRLEFMQRLERALADVSAEERQEALQYYRDYLDDAGIGEPEDVPESLGAPEKIAASIRGSVAGDDEMGSFTEKGFTAQEDKDYPAKWQETSYKDQTIEENSARPGTRRSGSGWKLLAVVLLGILFAPVWIPVFICIFAVIFAVIAVIVSVLIAFVASAAAILAAGIAVTVWGITQLAVTVSGAVVLIGAGLLMTTVGFLLTAFFGWVFVRAATAMFRWLVALCRKPFHKKSKDHFDGKKGGEAV